MIKIVAQTLPSLTWTIIGGILLTVGDVALRSWFETHWKFGFTASFVIYVLGMLCMMMSFFGENIAIATVVMVLLNTILYLVISYYLYGDTLHTPQMIGIALGMVAIVFLKGF